MTRYLVAVATCLLLWLAIGATKAAAEAAPPDEDAQSEIDAVVAGSPAEADASTEAPDEAAGEEDEQGEGSDEGGSESGPPTQDNCDDCISDLGADEAIGEEEREPEQKSEKQPMVNFVVKAGPQEPGAGEAPNPIVVQGKGGQPIEPLSAPPIVPLPTNGLAQTGGGPGCAAVAVAPADGPQPTPPSVLVRIQATPEGSQTGGWLGEGQGSDEDDEDDVDASGEKDCDGCQSGPSLPDAIVEEEEQDRLSGRRRRHCARAERSRRLRPPGARARSGMAAFRPPKTVRPLEAEPADALDPRERILPRKHRDERGEPGPPWASPKARRAGLTDREWDVLSVLVTGASTREIARQLYISPRTVTNHLVHIYDKLGARSRSKVLAFVLGGVPDRPAE